jgi:hypothetical protein
MFKRKPRIKSISVGIAGDLIFVLGLGSDGKAYQWDALKLEWILHQMIQQKDQPSAS